MQHIDKVYAALTAVAPFGLALVGRRHDGRIVVGAAFEDGWALQAVLGDLRELLKENRIAPSEVRGWVDDAAGWIETAEQARRITGVSFGGTYRPIATARQALASMVLTQGPTTSRFQIDKAAPGAETLAQRIDLKANGGLFDAVAICCERIEDEFPGGTKPNYKPPVVDASFDPFENFR